MIATWRLDCGWCPGGRQEAIAQSSVNSIEATHYGHCRPSRQDISRPMQDAFGDVLSVFVDEVLAELTAMAEGWHPAAASGAKAAAGRSDAAQGGDGDLVCLFFAVCSGGPSDSSAISPSARSDGLFARWTRLGLWRRLLRSAAPHLAARLR